MKKCPYCAEEIQDEAIVCKHCGRELLEEKWRAYCAWYAKLTSAQQLAALRQLTPEKRAEAERAWKSLGYSQPTPVEVQASSRSGLRWLVALVVLGAGVLALTFSRSESERSSDPSQSAAASAEAQRQITEARRQRATEELAALPRDAPLQRAAGVCLLAADAGAQLTATQAERCQSDLVKWADEAMAGGNLSAANWRVKAAARIGPPNEDIEKLEKRLQEQELKATAKVEAAGRRAYAEALRERFLDAGLDIKVKASGVQAERLELTFVLFNDVWTHRFQKDGLVAQWQAMGFKRVDAKDGFGDYHVYWNL